MSREARVVRNSTILTLQYLLINIITIFVIGYIARHLGKEDYGVYSLAFAFPLIFESVGSLGLRILALREMSRDREHAIDYLGNVVPIRAVLLLLMAATIFIAALLLRYETRIIYAIIIAIGSAVCEQFSRIILDVFQAFEEMGKVASRDITVRLFTASMSIFMLLRGHGLYAVCLVYLAGSILGLIINIWMYSRRFEYPKMRFEYKFLRDSLKESSMYILIGFAVALSSKVDIVLVSKLTDSTSLGIYNASLNLFSRLDFVADAVATASFPALCELYWTYREEANTIFSKAVLSMLILSLPIAIGGFILSEKIITFIYGSNYIESAKVFSILILSTPLIFLDVLLVSSLNAIKQQRFVAMAVSVTVVVSFILNFLFIHWIGYVGAAVATLITKIFFFIFILFGAQRFLKYSFDAKTVASILVSLVCLGYIAYMARSFSIYITIPLAGAVYLACLKVSGQFKNIRILGRTF